MPSMDRGATLQRSARGASATMGPQPAPAPAAVQRPPQMQMPSYQPPQIQMPAQVQAPPPVEAPQVTAPPIPSGAGGAGGAGGAPGVPSAGGVPGVHGAYNSPELQDYLARVKARLDNPGSDTSALNQAGIAIREFANGQRNSAGMSAAQRGVLGAGAGAQVSDDIGVAAGGQFAKAAEGIAIARQRDNDNALFAAQGAFAEPGRQNLADRGLGVAAQGQQNQLELSRADMNLRAQMANQNAAQGVAAQNLNAQLQAAQMAQQQQMQMMQIYANLYGR